MKIDTTLIGHLAESGPAAARLEGLGYDGVYTFEGPHDPFFPLALAAKETQRVELCTAVAIAFARNPMLLAKGTEENESHDGEAAIKRIIIPLDGSHLAERALPHAALLAKALEAELDIVRVSGSLTDAYYGEGLIPEFEERIDAMREEAKKYLDEKAEQLSTHGVENASCIIETGDAGARIIELAQQTPDSLVTMCSHGRSGVSRWFLGSTTERVVRKAPCPVLTVRPPS